MTAVEWSAVLAAAGGLVDLAIRLVREIQADGRCTVAGCPAHVSEALLADARLPIPAVDEASARARADARKRVAGLDRASIRARLDPEARASGLVPRPAQSAFGDGYATPEAPAAAEVYPDPGDDDGA